MESVTSCAGCGAPMQPGEVICRPCGKVAVVRSSPARAAPVPPGDGPPAVCAAVGCGAPLAPQDTECRHCGTPRNGTADALTLAFPWGTHELAVGDELVLGRDPADCPVADRLQAHTNISRRHATLRLTSEGLLVRDEGSSNGTFVDDVRVSEQLVARSARIRLAADFSFEVRTG